MISKRKLITIVGTLALLVCLVESKADQVDDCVSQKLKAIYPGGDNAVYLQIAVPKYRKITAVSAALTELLAINGNVKPLRVAIYGKFTSTQLADQILKTIEKSSVVESYHINRWDNLMIVYFGTEEPTSNLYSAINEGGMSLRFEYGDLYSKEGFKKLGCEVDG